MRIIEGPFENLGVKINELLLVNVNFNLITAYFCYNIYTYGRKIY